MFKAAVSPSPQLSSAHQGGTFFAPQLLQKGEMGMHNTGPRLAAENPCCFMASLKHNKKMMCICSSLIPRPRTASYVLEVTEHMYNHRLASALEQALGNV